MTQIAKTKETPLGATITKNQRKVIATICNVSVQYVHNTLHEYNNNKKDKFSRMQKIIIMVSNVFLSYNLKAITAAREVKLNIDKKEKYLYNFDNN